MQLYKSNGLWVLEVGEDHYLLSANVTDILGIEKADAFLKSLPKGDQLKITKEIRDFMGANLCHLGGARILHPFASMVSGIERFGMREIERGFYRRYQAAIEVEPIIGVVPNLWAEDATEMDETNLDLVDIVSLLADRLHKVEQEVRRLKNAKTNTIIEPAGSASSKPLSKRTTTEDIPF